jgi:signal peptidase complex subunit 3
VGLDKGLRLLADDSDSNVHPAQYSLKYNVMPYVGVLTYGEAARTVEAIEFPDARDSVS